MASSTATSDINTLPTEWRNNRPPLAGAAQRPNLVVRAFHFVSGLLEGCFGIASLIVGLAVLATYPVLQLLSLGFARGQRPGGQNRSAA